MVCELQVPANKRQHRTELEQILFDLTLIVIFPILKRANHTWILSFAIVMAMMPMKKSPITRLLPPFLRSSSLTVV